MATNRKSRKDNRVRLLYELEGVELPDGERFGAVDGAQNLCNFVTTSPAWAAMGNLPKKVIVVEHKGKSWSHAADPNIIMLSRDHFDTASVLHELAHFAAPKTMHGPDFINAYLKLVAEFMGLHYRDLFMHAFRRIGIRF